MRSTCSRWVVWVGGHFCPPGCGSRTKLHELKEALEDEKYLFQVGGWGVYGVGQPGVSAPWLPAWLWEEPKDALEDEKCLFQECGCAYGVGGRVCPISARLVVGTALHFPGMLIRSLSIPPGVSHRM